MNRNPFSLRVLRPLTAQKFSVCPELLEFARFISDASKWRDDDECTEVFGDLPSKLVGSKSSSDVEAARRLFFIHRALTVYVPLAFAVAVAAFEEHGRDCTGLRSAALMLCERPCRETSLAASRAARQHIEDAIDKDEAAYCEYVFTAAYAAHAAEFAAEAANFGWSGDVTQNVGYAVHAAAFVQTGTPSDMLRIAADDLRAACEITEATL